MLAKAIARVRGELVEPDPVPEAPKPTLRPALWVYESGGEPKYSDLLVEFDNGVWAMAYVNPAERPFVVEASKLRYKP